MTRLIAIVLFALLPSLGISAELVVIPNMDILGKQINSIKPILTEAKNNTNMSPYEVRCVLDKGVIDEVQAFYDKEVSVAQIASTINTVYGEYEVPEVRTESSHLWRIPSKKIAILLREDGENKVLIVTRMSQAKIPLH